jgi:hypothetical protein
VRDTHTELVEAAKDDAAESILLLVPGYGRGAPKTGDTVIPNLLPGQWTWIPNRGSARSWSVPSDSGRAPVFDAASSPDVGWCTQ